MITGIDAGGTLIKLVTEHNGQRFYAKYPSSDLSTVASLINSRQAVPTGLTGGKAALLHSLLNKPATIRVEFEATCEGVRRLMLEQGMHVDSFVLTNVGTGTSIHALAGTAHSRLGGTGVGGGTLLGLSYLLTGLSDFRSIASIAAKGNRERIDLLVKDIYQGETPPISGDLTAANFGKVSQHAPRAAIEKADQLAAVIRMVGETIAVASVMAAKEKNLEHIAYIGSTFHDNILLRQVVESYTHLCGYKPLFINNGEFSGALGAMDKL